ncbi:MAG: hypothetical protein ACE5HW_03590 [Candidatus Methanofastidiosia archaeon]
MKKFILILLMVALLESLVSASDVSLSRLTFSPIKPKDGEEVTISYEVSNSSWEKTYEVKVELFLDDELLHEKRLKLEPRKLEILKVFWRASEGIHTVKAILSYFEEGAEVTRELLIEIPVLKDTRTADLLLEKAKEFYAMGYWGDANLSFTSARDLYSNLREYEKVSECQFYLDKIEKHLSAEGTFKKAEELLKIGELEASKLEFEKALKLYEELEDSAGVERTYVKLRLVEEKLSEPKMNFLFVGFLILIILLLLLGIYLNRRGEKPSKGIPEKVESVKRRALEEVRKPPKNLSEILVNCDAFSKRYSSRLSKDELLQAYNDYSLLRAKFEDLSKDADQELLEEVSKKLDYCFMIIQSKIREEE